MSRQYPSPHKIPAHLTQNQRDGLACVHCARQTEPMRPSEAWTSAFTTLYECVDSDACTDLMDPPPAV